MTTTADRSETIRASLQRLIAQARAEHKWLWCYYQDLWFSPDDLDKANVDGKFLWGPVNWKLRHPSEHQAELEQRTADAIRAETAFKLRWHK